MADENDNAQENGLEAECRPPSLEDVIKIASELNHCNAKYVIVGGFAIIEAGYMRQTMDIDFLIEAGSENEKAVLKALSTLPDGAAKSVTPGDVAEYGVVRIGDEVMIDLMKSGCGVTYADAIKDAVWRELQGVRIPFASRSTLWKMKQTVREKDVPDRLFLAKALTDEGIPLDPPLKNPAPESAVPAWVEHFFSWLKGRRGS